MKENNYLLKLHNNKLEDLFLKKIGIPKIIIGNKKTSKFKGEFYLHHELLYNITIYKTIKITSIRSYFII